MADLDPHQECAVCEATRENHGDLNHRFSEDGQLVLVQPGAPPRQQPPELRGESSTPTLVQTQQMTLRLIDVLTHRDLLTAPELVFIFGGEVSASKPGGATAAGAEEGSSASASD